jgi:OOP family OmpA-OmpF porin
MSRNILILLTILTMSVQIAISQHVGKPQAVGIRALMVDYQGPYNGEFDNFKAYKPGFEAFYARSIHPSLNVMVPLRVGLGSLNREVENFTFVGLDAQLQWHYHRPQKPVTPFLFSGFGYAIIPATGGTFEIPVGGGLDIHLNKYMDLSVFASWRFGDGGEMNSFQHGIGFKYYLLRKEKEVVKKEVISDIDGDGIPDHLDECPTIPGLAQFNGCPDTDGDGIPDHLDDCPFLAGTAEFNGCPDTDGDGIPDHMDDCPLVAGPKENRGCPVNDSDGDGIPDDLDKCPNEFGLAKFDGCPDTDGDGIPDHLDDCPLDFGPAHLKGCPDSDGDGVPDYLDKCPFLPGPASNFGCPELRKDDQAILDKAMRAVQFDLRSSVLRPSSYPTLDQIVQLMAKYPQYSLSIEGHTDITGDRDFNLLLSENRAKSCYEYLVSRGVDSSRMSYRGFGITKPLYNNNTEEGRVLNRRVEFIMVIK